MISVKTSLKPEKLDIFELRSFKGWKSEDSSETGKKYLPAEFCMESSLHGLKFIGQPKRHIVERIFWLISFLVSVTIAIVLIVQIWDKYRRTPVITVFQPTETTIDLIPFPAVTICNTNNVIKSKAEEFVDRVVKNPDDLEAHQELYLMDHICHTAATFSEIFNFSLEYGAISSDVQEIYLKPHQNNRTEKKSGKKITDLLQKVAQKCSDMIILCMWQNEVRNCSDLFDEVETDFGYCCVFNMMPLSLLLSLRNDSRDNEYKVKEWAKLDLDTDNIILSDDGVEHADLQSEYIPPPIFPYRQNRPGKTTGLSVLLDPDLESYFCTNTDSSGFMALAHNPLDFPRIADEGVAIKPNTETYLKIVPSLTLAEDGIQGFSLDKRNCYFGKEWSLKYYNYYTSSNCENECIANITYKECNCIRYFMPRDDTQSICGASKFNCSERVRKKLLQEGLQHRCRMCLPSCTEIEYQMTTSYMPLRNDIPLWKFPNGTDAFWTKKNVTILHVHFSVDSTYAKLRKELYGFIDLLSSTGGLLSLCLGFSGLSLLEIIYFITLRLYCQTQRGKNMGHKMTQASRNLWRKAFFNIKNLRKISPTHNKSFYDSSIGDTQNGHNELIKNMSQIYKSDAKLELDTLPYYIEKGVVSFQK